MAELQLLRKDQLLRSYPLSPGGITIGSAPDNQIQLDSPAVAERHARVFTVGHSSVIQDLGSDSGTYINDAAISRQTLRHDDLVQIGNFRLRFSAAAHAGAGENTAAKRNDDAGQAHAVTGAGAVATEMGAAVEQTPLPDVDHAEADDSATWSASAADETPGELADAVDEPGDTDVDAARADSEIIAENEARSDLEITIEDEALDDLAGIPVSEDDLDLISDSETLIDAADTMLREADTEELALRAAAREQAERNAAPDSEDDGPGAAAFEPAPETTGEAPAGASAPSEDEGEPAPAAGLKDEDPSAVAMRERIRAKVSANAEAVAELDDETPDYRVEEQPSAAQDDEDEVADSDDDDSDRDTVLEFLPDYSQPRGPAAAPQGEESRSVEARAADSGEDAAMSAPRRAQSLELPAPPQWSIDGDDTADGRVAGEAAAGAGGGRHYAAVDILSGPNAGLRVWLGKPRTMLGVRQDRALIIEEHNGGYRAAAAQRGATVTLNGTLLLSTPENLQDGDQIEFANMSVKFLLTDVRPAHPDDEADGPGPGPAPETAPPAPSG